MSVLSSIKEYIQTYAELKENAPVWVDNLGVAPTEYGIISLPGARVSETYLNGATEQEYPFALQSMEATADELERLENNGFFEAFMDWIAEQDAAGTYPDMDEGKTPTKIETLGWGFLYQEGESQTGIYQIQCLLSYEQVATGA